MGYIIRQSANRNDLLIEREHRKGGTAVALIFMADDMRDTAERVVKMLEDREEKCLFDGEKYIDREQESEGRGMTHEAEAVELLHRVLNYFVGEFAFPEKMERLLEEIEAFLTDIEAEEKGL